MQPDRFPSLPDYWQTPSRGKVAPPGALGQRRAGKVKLWMFLVTGGAGFIGSNVVASLNEAGHSDVVVNDSLG